MPAVFAPLPVAVWVIEQVCPPPEVVPDFPREFVQFVDRLAHHPRHIGGRGGLGQPQDDVALDGLRQTDDDRDLAGLVRSALQRHLLRLDRFAHLLRQHLTRRAHECLYDLRLHMVLLIPVDGGQQAACT